MVAASVMPKSPVPLSLFVPGQWVIISSVDTQDSYPIIMDRIVNVTTDKVGYDYFDLEKTGRVYLTRS